MKVKISEIKHELALEIEATIDDMAEEVYTIIPANSRPRNFRGKYICRVSDPDAAAQITGEVKRLCREATETAVRNGVKLAAPITYAVSTITTRGKLHMGFSDAKSVGIVKGEDLRTYILTQSGGSGMTRSSQDAARQLLSRDRLLYEIDNALASGKIDPDREYRVRRESGTSFRITYYDCDTDSRHQISVGDVLIVNSKTSLEEYVPKLHKKRSDIVSGDIVCSCDPWTVMEL